MHINNFIEFSNRTISFSSKCIRLLDRFMRRTEVDAAIVTSVIKYKTVNTRQVIRFIGCIFFSFTLDTLRNLQESTELKQVQFEPYGIYFIFFLIQKQLSLK